MPRIFRLVTSLELTIDDPAGRGEGDELPLRIDVFRDPQSLTYRARLWEFEFYRIQSTFPQADSGPPTACAQ